MSFSSWPHYYLTVITLLDRLDPKEYHLKRVSVILRGQLPLVLISAFDGTKPSVEFCRIVSKFLVNRERAGFFWVNSQKYADLARYILDFLRDK